jgi:hypothetical protein
MIADTLLAIIIGSLITVYGTLVYNGKMLWILITYKENLKKKLMENIKREGAR